MLVCGSGWTGFTCFTTPTLIPKKCWEKLLIKSKNDYEIFQHNRKFALKHVLCGGKLQADFIRAEKMQSTARYRWSTKAIELLWFGHEVKPYRWPPCWPKRRINYNYAANLFCPGQRKLILLENPQVSKGIYGVWKCIFDKWAW